MNTSSLSSSSDTPAAPSLPIVFFDGVCNLCDVFVSFAVRADTAHVFHFAPLQGSTAGVLTPEHARTLTSVVLRLEGGEVLIGADAVLAFLARLPARRWKMLAALGRAVPRPLREVVYRAVARVRYRVFGRKVACRVPTADERERFLP
jgi:predicted DCC family thiol-disulfide oxidoreductase YuxK